MKTRISSKEDIDNLYNYCISLEEEEIDIDVKELYDASKRIKAFYKKGEEKYAIFIPTNEWADFVIKKKNVACID